MPEDSHDSPMGPAPSGCRIKAITSAFQAEDGSSILPTRSKARVAQLVEHDLAKVRVASSNLVSRSNVNLKKGTSVSLSGTLSPDSHIMVS